MEMQRELDILPPPTPEARRKAERDARLRAAGIIPASSSEPWADIEPIRLSWLTRLRARFWRR